MTHAADEETGLARREEEQVIQPLGAEVLAEQMKAFNRTKGMILQPEDFQKIEGRDFIKKSGWRRLAVAFKLSTEIRRVDITRDETRQIISADVIARASYSPAIYREAYGGCDIHEKRFQSMLAKGKEIKGQDIVATAQTRAVNRAISDLIAGGEVTADEMSYESAPRPQKPPVGKLSTKKGSKTPEQISDIMALLKQMGVEYDPEFIDRVRKEYKVEPPDLSAAQADKELIRLEALWAKFEGASK